MRFAGANLRISVNFEAEPNGGVSKHTIDETKLALRELGLSEDISSE
jgi:hypothetical protein